MCFFFFNDTATTEIYTLSLHDALPICRRDAQSEEVRWRFITAQVHRYAQGMLLEELSDSTLVRSEEHTSELQSPCNLVCRLLLEKKKKKSDTRCASLQALHALTLVTAA